MQFDYKCPNRNKISENFRQELPAFQDKMTSLVINNKKSNYEESSNVGTMEILSNSRDMNFDKGSQHKISSNGKRGRTNFSPEQLFSLEREFERGEYLTRNRRRALSNYLGLPEETIKIWFQNRRMKNKRKKLSSADESCLPVLMPEFPPRHSYPSYHFPQIPQVCDAYPMHPPGLFSKTIAPYFSSSYPMPPIPIFYPKNVNFCNSLAFGSGIPERFIHLSMNSHSPEPAVPRTVFPEKKSSIFNVCNTCSESYLPSENNTAFSPGENNLEILDPFRDNEAKHTFSWRDELPITQNASGHFIAPRTISTEVQSIEDTKVLQGNEPNQQSIEEKLHPWINTSNYTENPSLSNKQNTFLSPGESNLEILDPFHDNEAKHTFSWRDEFPITQNESGHFIAPRTISTEVQSSEDTKALQGNEPRKQSITEKIHPWINTCNFTEKSYLSNKQNAFFRPFDEH